MQDQNFPIHSIIMLVGPASCGKTTFANDYLMPKLEEPVDGFEPRVHRVSSDEIRKDLLAFESVDKNHPLSQQVSIKAFDILKHKVEALATYPNNSHYIIIDSTALNEQFRQDISDIASRHNYNVGCVVFSYKNAQDYYNNVSEDDVSRETIRRQHKKLNQRVISKITSKYYDFNFRVVDLNFGDISIDTSYKNIDSDGTETYIDYKKMYADHQLKGPANHYIHIGDVHGCYSELRELLEKFEFEFDENDNIITNSFSPILVGDFVDKGTEIRETIEFIHKNLDKFYIVKGNHENFVYQWFTGNINPIQFSNEFIDKHFNTINALDNDEELKQKFFEIFAASKEFYQHEEFIVTHAPASVKYLGKIDRYALKRQRDIKFPRPNNFDNIIEYNKAFDETFAYLREERQSARIFPINVFGHIKTRNSAFIGSRLNIDTACADGHKLTGVIINGGGNKPFFQTVKSKQPNENIPEWNFNEKRTEEDIDVNELEPKEKGRVLWGADKGVQYVSGTMSPADKNDYELESLYSALTYYYENGINEVVLQPKYMGSRCTIYLHKNIDECYATSRKGYVIDHVDLTPVFKKLHQRTEIQDQFSNRNVKMLILDSELLPWNLLGKNLIDRDFKTISYGVTSEISMLENEGFEEQLKELHEDYDQSDYENLSKELNKKELKEHFNSAKERTFRSLRQYFKQNCSLDDCKEYINIFNRQVELYGDFESEPYAKPFSILKTIYEDDTEKLHFEENNDELFEFLNDDQQLVVNLDDNNAHTQANMFFQNIVKESMEGIVVKPKRVFVKNIAPFLKVRNEDYLTLAYGYNYKFPPKYDKLIRRKKIYNKLKASINEFEVGKRMLEIPYNDIHKNNQEYINLYARMIAEEKEEEEMDPRL